MKKKRNSKFGFTLVELIVVITIISLLAAFGLLTNYRAAQRRARDGKRKADLEQLRSALEIYRVDSGAYPSVASYSGLGGVLVSDYIKSLPTDPAQTTKGYTYFYQRITASEYRLCAHLEAEDPGECSGINCDGAGIPCNYEATNP